MQRQKCRGVLLYPIPLLTAQEHTFPAHVWEGSLANFAKTSGLGSAFVWKCKKVVLIEAILLTLCSVVENRAGRTGGELGESRHCIVSDNLIAYSPVPALNYGGWLFHFSSCLCLNTWCVRYWGNLNASIHFIKSFCDVSQLFMIQVSSIRNTYVTPQRFIKWGLSQCAAHCEDAEGGAIAPVLREREQSFWVDIHCNFSEKQKVVWKCCKDEPLHRMRARSQGRTLPSCTAWI